MRILFITAAFAPNEFSEGIVNSKLVLALKEKGYHVDVISRGKVGQTYSSSWTEPWLSLEANTFQVNYKLGNKLVRFMDYILASVQFFYPLEGIRWIKRAFSTGEDLIRIDNYDLIMTRSPSDIAHIVGMELKRKYKIPWIANWNDPSDGIIPKPYKNNPSKIANYISRYFTQKALSKADYITFPCDRLQNRFAQYFNFSTEKCMIIPHIGMSLIQTLQTCAKDNNLTICHAGSLSIERTPEILFKSIARINKISNNVGIRFIIIGFIDDNVRKLIQKYNLKTVIETVESKSYLESLKFISNYDILCIIEAILDEGIFLPSKLSDYIYLNKPILCLSPPEGTLVDIFNKYGGGLVVNNENYNSVYEGLMEFLKSHEEDTLSHKYSSQKLAQYLSSEHVLSIYDTIFKKIENRYNI